MENLPKHIERWSDPDFIPYPASWLNGCRWEDELETKFTPTVIAAWWSSDDATLAYGRQKGVLPKRGESMPDYRRRLKGAA
jgi:hypothetical protein